MARKTRHQAEEEVDLDEVDTFSANQEKILLDSAGKYGSAREYENASDEEVLGLDHGEDLDESEEEEGQDEQFSEQDEEQDEEDEDAEKGWGSRKDYYGGDDGSDDEDAKQMSAEALKQQKKHLQDLALDDYIDEDMMQDWQKSAEVEEVKQTVIINKDSIESLDDADRLNLLSQSFPEFVPLLKELQLLQPKLSTFKSGNRVAEVKKIALSAYLASIASYFAMFADNLRSGDFTTMKDNPVMESILTCREVWRQADELSEKRDHVEKTHEVEISDEDQEMIESDAEEVGESESEDSETADASEDEFDIDITQSRKIKGTTKKGKVSDFTESSMPDDVDMEEKQRRRKTLRFYTSKIDKASKRNGVASSQFAGDLDLPYQERLFERQQRLIEEARKRGVSNDGADLDGEDYVSADEQEVKDLNEGSTGDSAADAYYESLKATKEIKKVARRQAHEDAITAAKEGKLAELQETVGEDGKRAVSYQILKNKGLTPHRKKEFRNSRVKKRMQYDKAQKKLKSVRQVYDESNRGPYEGEKTGIKKSMTRSVKLI